MIKKGKQAGSQQQIQVQNAPQIMLQIQPKQMKLENPKKIAKPQVTNPNPQQQVQITAPPQNPESGQKMKKQNTHLVLPSIYRGNNFQALPKRRQASASRENINLPTYITDKRGDDDEIFSESENRPFPSQRKMQRPQSFIMKKKDKKGDSISTNITPSNKLLKVKSIKHVKQYSNNNSPTISEKGLLHYDNILYNAQTSKNQEKIKFNPWKRLDEKKEENYEKLLLQLNDLKKKHKEQMEQYQQKQQQSEFDNPDFQQMQLQHEQHLLENKEKIQSFTPHSLPDQKENYESFSLAYKQNSLGIEKQIDNNSKVSNTSSQKGDQSSIGQIQAPQGMEVNSDMDRNIWKRKKVNERNQIMEECSSIERELYQVNFLHNKNSKAINEYINTQNSLLKLNFQVKIISLALMILIIFYKKQIRKQSNINQPQIIKN